MEFYVTELIKQLRNEHMKNIFLFFMLLCLTLKCFSQKPSDLITKEPEIGIVEHLNEYVPDNIEFVNEDGNLVNLKGLIDRPTIINFVYFRCPGICSPLMSGIAEVINKTDMVLGKDYQVLTISFDPSEGTELAVKKKKNYINEIGREVDKNGWKFFTGDSTNIASATNAFGFKYKKRGNDFDHPAVIIMVSPDGKITRYLVGTYFLPFDIKISVAEALKGKTSTTTYKLIQYCYSFDQSGKRYVLNVTKVAGTIILFFAFVIFISLVLKKKFKGKNFQTQKTDNK